VIIEDLFTAVAIEDGAGLANEFRPVVAGNGFKCTIHGNNDALGIQNHNTVMDRVYHCFPVCVQFLV